MKMSEQIGDPFSQAHFVPYLGKKVDLLTRTYLSSLQLVWYRVAAVKRLTVYNHTADYIFWSFMITELILSYLKIEFRLIRC